MTQKTIHVCIIDENENEILNFSTESAPNYTEGQILYLEVENHAKNRFPNVEEIKLTEYKIIRIHHSIRKSYCDVDIYNYIGLEVYVTLKK